MRTTAIVLGAAVVLLGAPALATPCATLPTGATWCVDTGSATLEAPGALAAAGQGNLFVPVGSSLLLIDSATGAETAGPDLGTTITTAAMPMLFGASDWAVFVGTQNGYVYRLDAATGACVWKSFTGRTASAGVDVTPGCAGTVASAGCTDPVYSTPALRVGADAASSTVYVGTHYGGSGTCATTTRNRVYALNASTGDPLFVYNAPGTNDYRNRRASRNLDYISGGVFPDVWDDGCSGSNRDRVYFGADSNGSNNLYALGATTGLRAFSRTLGAIWTTPVLSYNPGRCGRMYVGTNSDLRAVSVTNTSLWTVAGGATRLDIAVAQFGANLGLIWVTTTTGIVRVYRDNGTSASLVCTYTPSAGLARSKPLYAGDKVYVGLSNGTAAQFDAATCANEVLRTVGGASDVVGDGALDADEAWSQKWVLFGTSAGRVARFNIPWAP